MSLLGAVKEALTGVRLHTVMPGQNLADLSVHYYGDARHSLVIFQHNRDTIADPNRIYPGQKIVIPHILGR